MIFKKNNIFFFFIAGLLIRLFLVFLDYSFDVNNHIVWAKDLWNLGFSSFYEKQSSQTFAYPYPNYPPLSIFIFYLFYPIQKIFFNIAWFLNSHFSVFPSNLVLFIENRAFLAGIMKLPAIFADLGIAWILLLFAKKVVSKVKRSYLLIFFVLFNPAFFYNSAYWGQIDAIPIFFALTSFYVLFYTKRYLLSGILFTLALLVKPTVLVYLPIYVAFLVKNYGLRNSMKTFAISNILFLVCFIPFLKNINELLSPYSIYYEKILAAQSLPYVTNGAFNFWVLITRFDGIKDTASFIFGLSYRLWGYLIVGIIFVLVAFFFLKAKDRLNAFLNATFFGAFASFLFLTKMHERYLILTLPILLLLSLKNRAYIKWFFILSIVSFLNLYHSWPVPRIELIFAALSNPYIFILISGGNVFIFLYLLKRSFQLRKKPR